MVIVILFVNRVIFHAFPGVLRAMSVYMFCFVLHGEHMSEP